MVARVYSYTRFSDPRQAKGSSSDRQAAYAAKWAADHGLELDSSLTLRDEGLSAYTQAHVRHGALGVFLEAVQQGRIPVGSVLVVEGLDRLSRAEPILAQSQLGQIVNAGITVVTASDGKAYSRETLKANPMDLIYSLLIMIRAHEESDTKSKRVNAAIKRQCEAWMAGTSRPLIRNGKDPFWLRLKPGGTGAGPDAWEFDPAGEAMARTIITMYCAGYGGTKIIEHMLATGMTSANRSALSLKVYALKSRVSLVGSKELTIDGTTYVLPNYYPALITQAEFDEMQALAADRSRRTGKGDIPSLVTGLGIATCGYCGQPMLGQMMNKRRYKALTDIPQGNRRVRCIANFRGLGCQVPGSCSVVPIEQALISYCSDMINLRALYRGDRSTPVRAALAKAHEQLTTLDRQINRITEAMLASDQPPQAFVAKARTLEEQRAAEQKRVSAIEAELALVDRADIDGADTVWRDLAAGVTAMDYAARVKARQLVKDTFERIVIWHGGIRPSETPKWSIDLMLVAKGGQGRLLRITRAGDWTVMDDIDNPE